MNKKILIIHIAIWCCIVICYFGYRWIQRCDDTESYTYRAFCGSAVNKKEYVALTSQVRDVIDAEVAKGTMTRMGVYFRDLRLGPTLFVNADELFVPASLLKLPLAMAYFKAQEEMDTETNPIPLLSRHIAFKGELDSGAIVQTYRPLETLLPETSYSIGELIQRMLIYSDNAAYGGLFNFLYKVFPKRDYLLETYRNLGLIAPKDGLEENLSPRLYGGLLRQLYGASYLSQADSEAVIATMRQSEFRDGLRAGVPDTIEIAHKFGERQFGVNGKWEIHDCGIIYYPKNPYMLCVMGEGRDNKLITNVIAEISKMVYQEFDARQLQ